MSERGAPDCSERWLRVNAVLGPALKLPVEQVGDFVRRACGDDEELRGEVLTLLQADRDAGGFLEEAVATGARDLLQERDRPESRLGQQIGAYRLEQTLGSGGMSTVFLGVRADERFEKRVAVKVLKRGMDTDEVLHRFRQERQILASLDHPNIARLLDACSTDDGLPAFVLEHIEGLPVDTYCDRRRLGIRERIELFRTVCSAVQYAHQNLVVHRDLKPSNILVTEDGAVKLLDFGIAKILAPEKSSQTSFSRTESGTLHATRAMTPSYASPEQVRGESITTASDVYTLGVLLYELLTGTNPQRLVSGGPAEIERVVCQQEPRLPSASVAQRKEGEPLVVQVVEDGPRKLQRRLAGDLDTILLKALSKEPQRRYASVDQLSEDLRRYLLGFPVLAQRDRPAYRMSKFVRRHRAAVAVAAILAATVVGSALVAIYQARAAIRAQARAEEQQARAEAERDAAETVLAFVNDLFEVADPSQEGSTITAGELLNRGAERIPRDSSLRPATRARLMTTIGRIDRKLGLYDRAVPLLDESVTLLASEPGSDPAQQLESLNELGLALFHQAEHDRAATVFRQALVVSGESPEVVSLERVDSLNGLALVLDAQGERAAAAELYREALDLAAARQQGNPGATLAEATSLNGLAMVLVHSGDFTTAEPLLRRALEIRWSLAGEGHQDTAQVLHNLATVLVAGGRLDEAEPVLRQALELRRSLLGGEHPEVVRTLNLKATMDYSRGDLVSAEALYRELMELRPRVLGEKHTEIASGINNLAKVIAAQGRWDEAEPLYRQALEQKVRLQGVDHRAVPVTLQGLGEVLFATGRMDEAEPVFRRALTLRRTTLLEGNSKIAETLVSLGRVLLEKGTREEAEVLLQEAVEIFEAAEPSQTSSLVKAQAALEACRQALRSRQD